MNEQHNQPNGKQDASTIENLVHLSEKNATVKTSDLNSRLQEIESELRHLNAREAATNKNFRELLSETRRHTNEQTDQLEEARGQILDVRENYKKLTQDYQRLAAGANILSVTLEQARSELSGDIETLRLSTQERTDQLADGQLQMIERANRIELKAQQMAEDLDSRVNVIRSTISALESKLLAEIRQVAEQSEQRDEALMIRTNMLEETFNEKTEALRQVDEQLAERASALEARTTRLDEQTEDLQFQANVLDTRTGDLEDRTDNLEARSLNQAGRLATATDTIDRHYKGFAIALALIVVTIGALSLLQQDRWLTSTATDNTLQNSINEQQAAIATQATTTQENSVRIDALETQSSDAHNLFSMTDEKVTTAINQLEQSINSLQAQADNNASRMNAMVPHRTFGQDNTIHGREWLEQQDPEQFVVSVMQATNKQDLYSVVYRWSSLFNAGKLAFLENQQNGQTIYTLVYGPFAEQGQAEMTRRRLPSFNYDQPPVAVKLQSLL